MKEQINPPHPVGAAQLVVFQQKIFLIDTGGRLWVSNLQFAGWEQIALPETPA
jgi:hypothetical protein